MAPACYILPFFFRQLTTKRFTWLLLPHGVFSLLPPAMEDAHVLLSNVCIEDLVTAQRLLLCMPEPGMLLATGETGIKQTRITRDT